MAFDGITISNIVIEINSNDENKKTLLKKYSIQTAITLWPYNTLAIANENPMGRTSPIVIAENKNCKISRHPSFKITFSLFLYTQQF